MIRDFALNPCRSASLGLTWAEIGLGLGEELLTGLFLAVLAAAWGAIFLPAVWRASRTTPFSSAERFRSRMNLIAPRSSSSGRWVVVPRSYEQLKRASFRRDQRRRQKILLFLVGGVALSLVGLLATGRGLGIHLAFDVSLSIYVALLLEAKRRRLERRHKVHRLPARENRVALTAYEPARAAGGPHS